MSKEEWDKDRSLDLDSYKTGYLQAIEAAAKVADRNRIARQQQSDKHRERGQMTESRQCFHASVQAKAIGVQIRALKPNEGTEKLSGE